MAKAKTRAGKGQHPKVKAGTSKEESEKRKALFAKEFIANGGNATQAAIKAGYSAKTADQQGSRLLKDVKVAALIESSRSQALQAADITVERVLREVGRVAFSDIRKLFDEHGHLKKVHELDDDAAAVLASVEVDEIGVDKVVIGHTRKVKMWDKGAALEKLMKHLGLYEKDNKQRADALGELLNQVDGSVLRPAGAAT